MARRNEQAHGDGEFYETPFDRFRERSLFQQLSEEYELAVAAGTETAAELAKRFGCPERQRWFQIAAAPPYNAFRPEARDAQKRTYMFLSTNELAVRLERKHSGRQAFPLIGEELRVVPNGGGGKAVLRLIVEELRLPPLRVNPKTAVLRIKQL